MPPLTSSAINKGKTVAPKAVARRRPAAAAAAAAAAKPTSVQSEEPPQTVNAASAQTQSSSQQPTPSTETATQPSTVPQDEAARQHPLPTPPTTQYSITQSTPPPQPHQLEPSPLALTSHQPAPASSPAPQPSPRQSRTTPQPSVVSQTQAPESTRQPSPAPSSVPASQPAPLATPQSPDQLAGQKRKRPGPASVNEPARSTSETAVNEPDQPMADAPNETTLDNSATRNGNAVQHTDTEAALINGLINLNQQQPAPVAQMVPTAATTATANPTAPKPRAKRQKKNVPAVPTDESQASAGAEDGAATSAPAPKPRKPRAKRQPKSAATIVEDENGNVIQTTESAEPARPAPKPRKPRQKKQKQPQEGEAEQNVDDEPIEDPESHEIDVTKTTMTDLTRDKRLGKVSERETKMAAIDWDEVHKKRLAEAEAIRAGQTPVPGQEKQTENGEGAENGENSATPRPAGPISGPRIRLDADGNIIVEEDSLRIDRQAQAAANAQNFVVTENDDLTKRVNQMSWINERRRDPTDRVPFFKMKSDPWSDEETDRFYDALRMFGTDFFIISKMFPPKTRRQIKLKFIREERIDADRVNKALNGEETVPMNLEHFAEATGQDMDGFKDPRELEEELRVEGEEQRVEIERKRKEMEEAKRQRDIQMKAREKDNEQRANERREKAAMRQNRKRGIFGNGTF